MRNFGDPAFESVQPNWVFMEYLPCVPLHCYQIDSCVQLYFRVSKLLTITWSRANTTCDFERGGATKPITGSS